MESPFIQQLLQADPGFFLSSLILFTALFLAHKFPLVKGYQPFIALHLLAKQLATKVNHSNRSQVQQLIAGTLASLLLMFPFWAIISFLLVIAAFPWFFELLVLYVCLSATSFTPTAEDITAALKKQDKQTAKNLLKDWVSHDTQGLSEVGLSKACISQLLTRPSYGTVSCILFFAIGGAPLVLAACMLRQLELSWPPYFPANRHFSRFIYRLNRVIFWLPNWLWNFSLAIQGGKVGFNALLSPPTYRHALNEFPSLYLGAKLLKVELGGPQKIPLGRGEYRLELDKIKCGKLPNYQDINLAIILTRRASHFWISFSLLIPLIWSGLRWLQSM
ncbi:cobalamin biosynthesis protein [Shewanella sp. SR44-3]|uniref:cobalamin biosynthesis protein CobD/CbiB n=1 Tax=unclassified Shewanella TaxID=196818 RepID=UPI0015FABF2D|nr:cobalamin biosynthesis protein [Shewanella sp. SR44-3]MBB1269801.1 cobalamin biosynthesis protein [Shewanella sp. SR44-3]